MSILNRRTGYGFYVFSFILMIYSLITLTPFVVVVMSSFKPYEDVVTNIWSLPTAFRIENFVEVIVERNFGTYIRNSVFITIVSLVAVIYLGALTAYGLHRAEFKGKTLLYYFFLMGLMFPVQLGLVPLFILMRNLSLGNSIFAVILIYTSGISIPVLVTSGFLHTVPGSIIESAKIDGAGESLIFHRLVVPLMRPVFAALTPLIGLRYWNDFFLPLVFLSKDSIKTIPLGLMKFFSGQYFDFSNLHLVFTAAAISIIPILIIYLVASKNIISGMTEGSIK